MLFNASHNRLHNIPKVLFKKILNVRHIDLSFNKIHILFDDCFSDLSELKIINLSNNQIQEIYGSFERNTKLKTIRSQNNLITKLGCNILKLIERSVLVNALFDLRSDLNLDLRACKGNKLKFSAENKEMIIRSTENNEKLIRINSTAFTDLESVQFGENQLENTAAVLNVLGSSVWKLDLSGNYIGKLNATTF